MIRRAFCHWDLTTLSSAWRYYIGRFLRCCFVFDVEGIAILLVFGLPSDKQIQILKHHDIEINYATVFLTSNKKLCPFIATY